VKIRNIRISPADADGCVSLKAFTEQQGEIGTLIMCPLPHGTMQVQFIRVHSAFRRRRVGTQLYQAAAHEACRQGRPLESDRSLAINALRFWEKQVHKGRAVFQADANRRTFLLRCPAPADLSGRRR
jgi:GNAT superfamily N-acetyltransferase